MNNRFDDVNFDLVELLNILNARGTLTKEEADICMTIFDNVLTSCVDIGVIKDYDIDELEGFLEKLVMK